MYRFLSMKRLSILFAGVFVLAVTGVFVLQRFWVDPGDRCEARGDWYDITTRVCATPIYIPDITGRPAGVTRAEASAAKNRELVELERQVTARQRGVDAAVEAGRAELAARKEQ